MRIAVYRNLKYGRGHNDHTWSRAQAKAGRGGGEALSVGPVSPHYVKPGQSGIIANARTVVNKATARRISSGASGGRAVFAWVTGEPVNPMQARPWVKGRRLGLRPDLGEFRFCYADEPGRPLCPVDHETESGAFGRTMDGVIFTRTGMYEIHWS